jgi:hypothetical protein
VQGPALWSTLIHTWYKFNIVSDELTAFLYRSKSKPRKQASSPFLATCCLLGLCFDHEDEDSTFLQNINKLLPEHIKIPEDSNLLFSAALL